MQSTVLQSFFSVIISSLTILLSLTLAPADTFSQDESEPASGRVVASAPLEEQRELNDEAVRAIGEEDYTKAVSYLEESLYMGELNITYLNLGRAYQLMGRCEKAREAFEKVSTAPKVEKPSADFLEAKAQQYREELEQNCQAEEPAPDTQDAPADTIERDSTPPEVDEGESSTTQPDDGEASSTDDSAATPPAAQADAGGENTLGWIAAVGGLALVGGGVGLHLRAEALRDEVSPQQAEFDDQGRVANIEQSKVYENQSSANTLDTISLSMGIVGGLAAATGAYLLVTGDADDEPTITVGPRTDAAGFVIDGRF